MAPGHVQHLDGTPQLPMDVGEVFAAKHQHGNSVTMDVEGDAIDEPPSKKRKTKASARGVAHLTPEQLAKKRANDREAQRAIRERTKKQIETLERRIEELTAQKPYQELQAVIQAKEAVERENAEIKQRLSQVVSALQSIIGTAIYPSPGQSQPSATEHVSASGTPIRATHESTATASVQSIATSQNINSQASSPRPSHRSSLASEHNRLGLDQQRDQLRHGLDMGEERLQLGFLLDSNQRIARIQSGANGPQDSSSQLSQASLSRSSVDPYVPSPHTSNGTTHSSFASGYAYGDPNSHTSKPEDAHSTEVIDTGDPNLGPVPRYSAPLRTSPATCPLDQLLLDFLHERRQRAAEGHSVHEVIGPRYPSVYSLLNPAHSVYSHPLSRVFTDILAKFPDISGLPERVAVLYIMFLDMRWQVSPTKENYERLPPWMRPSDLQIHTAHPAWIDHLPFPRMRDTIIQLYHATDYHFDDFFVPYTTTLRLTWPYDDTDTLLRSPDSDELMINPVFERHLRDLDNWKLGDAFARAFPSLAETCNLGP